MGHRKGRLIQAAVLAVVLGILAGTAYRQEHALRRMDQLGQQALQDRDGTQGDDVSGQSASDSESSLAGGDASADMQQAKGSVENLRVNYVTNPVGIDSQEITFSWEVQGFTQQAYRIVVEDEAGRTVWDSGVVRSQDTIQAAYGGEALQDLTGYNWLVLCYDENVCYRSGEACFETAYVNEEAFSNADFISMQGEENVYGDGQPVFYKAFEADGAELKKAYYLGSALGIYDVYINGERVGDAEFKPGWTDYNDTLLYNMYDVTGYIRSGQENHIAVMLGTGWWCGRNAFGTYDYHQPAVIGQLTLLYADGTLRTIATDSTWQYYKDTRIQFADFFNGETADLRKPGAREISMGNTQRLTPKDVVISHDFAGVFHSFYGYQNKRREQLWQQMQEGYLYEKTADNGTAYGEIVKTAEWKQEPEGGILIPRGQTLIVDLGQNIAGVPQITFSTETENEITVLFAEMLNDTGDSEKGNDGPKGSLYRKNYRSAETTVTIQADAGENQVYSPSFFFTGFRYLSVTAKEDVNVSDIKGICIGNDSPELGSFTCDNEKLNRLYENVLWSQRNNFTLIATDCPQRDERLGWMGDLQSFSTTSLYNQDLFSFYKKWNQDLLDAQTEEGAYTDTVPSTVITGSGNGGWAEAGIMVPVHVYDKYGDENALRQVYPSMKRYMDYLENRSDYDTQTGHLGPGTIYGDWLAAQETDSTFLSALWYGADAVYMQKTARILGEKQDEKKYEKLFQNIKQYIQDVYVTEDFAQTMSQTELCFLIRYGLLTDAQEKQALQGLVDSIEENEYRLMTGFAGTPILLHTLSEHHLTEYAYRILLCEENPSWLYSVNQGATTIWERYDSYTLEKGFADFAMNSFDHFNEGSVAQWLYEDMSGIRVNLSEEPAITIAPCMPDVQTDIHEASGSYHSILGEIKVSWSIEKEGMESGSDMSRQAHITFEIPDNATARVQLPIEGWQEQILAGGTYEFSGTLCP